MKDAVVGFLSLSMDFKVLEKTSPALDERLSARVCLPLWIKLTVFLLFTSLQQPSGGRPVTLNPV